MSLSKIDYSDKHILEQILTSLNMLNVRLNIIEKQLEHLMQYIQQN